MAEWRKERRERRKGQSVGRRVGRRGRGGEATHMHGLARYCLHSVVTLVSVLTPLSPSQMM